MVPAGVAGAGGRLSLRLHVLTRGMEQLSRWRGDGAESIGRCLERLHSSVDKLRRRGQPGGRDGLSEVAEGSEADEAEVCCCDKLPISWCCVLVVGCSSPAQHRLQHLVLQQAV